MAIRKRLLGLLFLVLAAVLVGGFILWAPCPGINVTREGVKLALEKITNRPISLEDVHIGFSPTSFFDITIKGVAIEFPDAGSSVSIQSLNLKPSVGSLIKLEVLISSITVKGLRASVTVGAGGHAAGFPLPIPLGGFSSTESLPDKPQAQEEGTGVSQSPGPGQGTGGRTQPTVELQIDRVHIIDARVDIMSGPPNDAQAVPVSLSDIYGEVQRQKDGLDYVFEFSGKIVSPERSVSPFRSQGFVKLADRQFPIAQADVEIAGDNLHVEPWARMLSPYHVALDTLTVERLTGRLSFQADSPCSVLLDVSLKGASDQKVILRAQADVQPSKSFDAIETIKVKTRIERLPIQFVEEILKGDFPLTFSAGLVHGEAQGFWKGAEWSTAGSIKLEGLIPRLAFFNATDPWSGSGEWEGDGKNIRLQKVHIASNDTNLTLSGDIGEPFSGDPTFNVDCRGKAGAPLITALLAPSVEVSGSVAVATRIKGSLNDLRLESNVEWASLDLASRPFFHKKSGPAATTSFTGRIFKTGGRSVDTRRLEGQLKGVMASVRIGKDVTTQSALSAQTEFQAKVIATTKSINLSEVLVTLGRSDSSSKMFSMSGDVSNLGSGSESFHFQSKMVLDRYLLNALSLLTNDVTVNGNSNAVFKVSGTRKRLNWNVNAPLNAVEVKIRETTLKPSGIPGNIVAAGTWQEGRLSLTKGELSVPGVFVTAVGDLVDRQGRFRHLDLEVKKADLAQIRKLFPNSEFTMSGSLFGHIKLQPETDRIAAAGALHLSNVGLALAKPNTIGCSGLKGVIEIQGNRARAEELTGALTGIVTAPLKLRGRIDALYTPDNLNGDVSIETGKGKIRTDFLAAATAIGDVLGPRAAATQQLLEITAGSASIRIRSGQAETQDLRVKGPAIAVGALGTYRFKDSAINSMLSIQTRMFENLPIGNIPVVKDFLKQHEGFLKALGVDKELSKYGIRLPQVQQGQSTKPNEQSVAPVTLMFTLRGPVQGPKFIPVLESSLDKKAVERLKKLSEL